jgi:cell division protein FtsI/penicillin-binding protein 2
MGLMTKEPDSTPKKVLSDETVIKLRKMTGEVSDNLNSRSELIATAGKTGTAQSGLFVNGKEILRTWFAGFFPVGNPNYVVVVLNEDGVGGNTDCAPVFRRIAEGIVGR